MRPSLYCSLSVYVFPFISTVLCELQSLTRTKTAPPPPPVSEHQQKQIRHVPSTGTWGSCGGNKSKSIFTCCVWLQLPCLETQDTQYLNAAFHQPSIWGSEALRLGQRAINLLKCHFQREMDCRGGIGKGREADGQVRGKISEDKSPA